MIGAGVREARAHQVIKVLEIFAVGFEGAVEEAEIERLWQ